MIIIIQMSSKHLLNTIDNQSIYTFYTVSFLPKFAPNSKVWYSTNSHILRYMHHFSESTTGLQSYFSQLVNSHIHLSMYLCAIVSYLNNADYQMTIHHNFLLINILEGTPHIKLYKIMLDIAF